MCMMMASMALGVVGAIGQYAAQKKATDEYNQQAADAHRDAQVAATYKYKDVQSKYIYDNKSLIQQGYTAALKARDSIGTGKASAGAMGFDPSSITIQNLVAQTQQQAAQNASNIDTKREDAQAQMLGQEDTIKAEQQQRINSTPFKSQPSPLGMILGIGKAVAGGIGSSGLMTGFNFEPA